MLMQTHFARCGGRSPACKDDCRVATHYGHSRCFLSGKAKTQSALPARYCPERRVHCRGLGNVLTVSIQASQLTQILSAISCILLSCHWRFCTSLPGAWLWQALGESALQPTPGLPAGAAINSTVFLLGIRVLLAGDKLLSGLPVVLSIANGDLKLPATARAKGGVSLLQDVKQSPLLISWTVRAGQA